MTEVVESALAWKEIEMEYIREIIADRWSEYYGVGIHEVNGSERGHEEVYESCMGSTDESLKTDDNVSTAYIDSGAEEHIWKSESGWLYLKNIRSQSNKCVRGITGDKVKLTHVGEHDILGRVHMGNVVCNLISLPRMLDENCTMIGDRHKCQIEDKNGNTIITGYREDKKMYQCRLSRSEDTITAMLSASVMTDQGIMRDRHLSGEEIGRAKRARMMHRSQHISYKNLQVGMDNGCYLDNMGLCGQDMKNAEMMWGRCRACIKGGMKAPKAKTSETAPASKVGERLAMDLHPMTHTSLGGAKWILYAVDEKSGYMMMCGMKDKSVESVRSGIRSIVSEVKSFGHQVKQILFDNEVVFNSVGVHVREGYMEPLYTPTGLHNRLIERYTQTVGRKTRILEADLPFILPNNLKAEVIFASKDAMNKTVGYKSGNQKTPYEVMTGSKPRLSDIKFGSTGLAYMNRPDRPNEKAEWGVYLGEKRNGSIRVYIPARKYTYSVRKFVAMEQYPMSWGWRRRSTLLDGGRMYSNVDGDE